MTPRTAVRRTAHVATRLAPWAILANGTVTFLLQPWLASRWLWGLVAVGSVLLAAMALGHRPEHCSRCAPPPADDAENIATAHHQQARAAVIVLVAVFVVVLALYPFMPPPVTIIGGLVEIIALAYMTDAILRHRRTDRWCVRCNQPRTPAPTAQP